MNRPEMLQALQADVDAWPQRVVEAGVKNAAGSAYRPVPRNVKILATPEDPEATYARMLREWSDADADIGSSGWDRVIDQAGPELTWEWLIADDSKPYAELFPPSLRARVRRALEISQPEQREILAAVRPRSAVKRRSSAENRAVEVRAVEVAADLLEREGWSVEDVGATRSYDLHCTDLDGETLFVEVKGTTGPPASIALTANEVELARRHYPDTALYVIHDITLRGGPNDPLATDGAVLTIGPWLPDATRLTCTAYSYRLDDEG